jgi:hypothetical protein
MVQLTSSWADPHAHAGGLRSVSAERRGPGRLAGAGDEPRGAPAESAVKMGGRGALGGATDRGRTALGSTSLIILR